MYHCSKCSTVEPLGSVTLETRVKTVISAARGIKPLTVTSRGRVELLLIDLLSQMFSLPLSQLAVLEVENSKFY